MPRKKKPHWDAQRLADLEAGKTHELKVTPAMVLTTPSSGLEFSPRFFDVDDAEAVITEAVAFGFTAECEGCGAVVNYNSTKPEEATGLEFVDHRISEARVCVKPICNACHAKLPGETDDERDGRVHGNLRRRHIDARGKKKSNWRNEPPEN